MISLSDNLILEILVRHGYLSQSDAEAAQASASKNGRTVIDELKALGLIMPQDVSRAQAADAGLPFIENLDHIHDDAVKAVPKNFALRYHIMPILKDGPILRIAIANPYDLETQDTLRNLLNTEIELVVAPPDAIEKAIKRHYGTLADSINTLISPDNNQPELILKTNTAPDEAAPVTEHDAPIIQMVNSIILDAHRMRASDIHLEPLEKRFRLRYRIDGVLQEMKDPPKRLQSAIISRIKIMSKMSIAEKRLPQDGRIQLTLIDHKQIDLRVSTVPTVHGEGIVMRILDKSSLLLGLPDLGFLSDDAAIMERLINLPDGIFLVTGPTGSGKTTTLYACLNTINKPDRKIITVEDPVEYQLSGINQVPVNEEVGMTFAAALRSMLRQAPNIIMIGEIRDAETASIAINASLTGHLVFSTLHTNDATSAVTRLIDIGVKPFLVASSVRAVMAQRLVRKICPACAEPYLPNEGELRALNLTPSQIEQANFKRGRGCDKCRGTGYKGRLGIFEIFVLDDEIRNMINDRQSNSAIRARARALGMRTLREDGIRKVLAGITTPEEVISTTLGDKN
jgi:general secretion pathway protein E/type IV pilus assembly protein PilB